MTPITDGTDEAACERGEMTCAACTDTRATCPSCEGVESVSPDGMWACGTCGGAGKVAL